MQYVWDSFFFFQLEMLLTDLKIKSNQIREDCVPLVCLLK